MEVLMTDVSKGCTFELTTCDYKDEWIVRVTTENGKTRDIAVVSHHEDTCYRVEALSLVREDATFGPSSELALSSAFSMAIRGYLYGDQADERKQYKNIIEDLDLVLEDLKEIKEKYKDILDSDDTVEVVALALSKFKDKCSDKL